MSAEELHPIVHELALGLRENAEGGYHFPDEAMDAALAHLHSGELDDEAIETVGVHLGVLAARFIKEAPDKTDAAVEQLCLLILLVYGSEEAAADVLEAVGLNRKKATALVGGLQTDYAALAERSKQGNRPVNNALLLAQLKGRI